ncbi:SDR family NAD(P)-dependent oxidoreductase [Novosphingobium sp. ST904]|uniref:SDR family NAD(P)-dependent oxidoreductase n=1 Tax=Novosphingobium sp. ST904 TaxID=1684385 RepID=UPI0006CD95E3|nr:SDR family NAD(P)-dependent oxidoreductase [Novosphingobium sp. ST904]KPH64089.1 2,5-dichloro-2,5-cyclohexadiene-1,4-diol dehydrogenase [Novosphingobium sp. ST904]TCM32475.1 2,5-dichloro-2,5-cyclohexadiene-1,4-diol dehydrogenase 2 [Novosphingobium sp. ST904]
MGRMTGKVALISGAATGLGAAQATRFCQEGAKVVIGDIDEPLAEETLAEIRAFGGDVRFVRLDATSAESWANAVAATVAAFGSLTTLCNNVGVTPLATIEEQGLEGWNKVIAVNQTSVFLGMQAARAELVKSGNGAVVNVGSLTALRGMPGSLGYSATKGAIGAMTRVAAMEWVKDSVRVNTIIPGPMRTRTQAGITEEQEQLQRARIPMGDLGRPVDVANGALFLASDEASYITGVELVIDGGWAASA